MIDPCDDPLPLSALLEYRRGELDGPTEAALEAHYFSCAGCAERLAWVEGLDDAVVRAMRQGLFDVFVRTETIERLERAGSVVRKYDVRVGESVHCTIAPDDDMTVVTLHGPIRPGEPVTLLVDILDHASGHRIEEARPAFQDPRTGTVHLRLSGVIQKSLGHVRVALALRFGDGPAAETAGPFVMNHAPWGASDGRP